MMRKLFDLYYEKNKLSIDKKPIFEFNNIFSTKLYDNGFKFDKLVCEEIKKFCKEQGHEIGRVIIISFMDGDLGKPEAGFSMSSDHYLKVVEGEDGKLEAVVLFGSSIKIQ